MWLYIQVSTLLNVCYLKKQLKGIVFISSISTKTILDDQGLDYHTKIFNCSNDKILCSKLGRSGIDVIVFFLQK